MSMYCKKCGKEIADESKYCQFCGTSQRMNHLAVSEVEKKNTDQIFIEVKEHMDKGKVTGKLYLIIGWISMLISLLFIPVAFGAISVIMGYLYRDTDEKMGTVLMIAGIAGAILGVLLGMSANY